MINTIAIFELKRMYKSPLFWFMLALPQLIFSFFLNNSAYYYIVNQGSMGLSGDNIAGATSSVAIPSLMVIGAVAIIVAPLITMRLIADEKNNHTYSLLASSPISPISLVLGKYLGILYFLFILLLFQFICTLLYLGPVTSLNYLQLSVTFLSLFMLLGVYAAIGLFCSSLIRSPMVVAVLSFGIIIFFWLVNVSSDLFDYGTIFSDVRSWLSLATHFSEFPEGVISVNSMLYFVIMIAYFLGLTVTKLEEERVMVSYNGILSYALLTGIVLVMAVLAPKLDIRYDASHNLIGSLHPSSIDTSSQFKEKVTFKLFVSENSEAKNNKNIIKLLDGYKRANELFKIEVISIDKNPDLANQFNIGSNLELVIQTESGRLERVYGRGMNERSVTTTLQKLLRGSNSIVLFISDHKERPIDSDQGNNRVAYSFFADQLRLLGIEYSPYSILTNQTIPDNVDLIVVVDPQLDYQESEISLMKEHIDNGGNGLFLFNSQPPKRLASFLKAQFGVTIGIKPIKGDNPEGFIAGVYQDNQNRQFQVVLYRPHEINSTNPEGWSVRKSITSYSASKNIALLFSRNEQKVIISSDASAMANFLIGQSGNAEMGINMINELSKEAVLANLSRPVPVDAKIQDDVFWEARVLGLFLIPFLLIIGWGLQWRRRQKRS